MILSSTKWNLRFLEQFLRNCKDMNRSVYTISNYRCDLEAFMRWFNLVYATKINKVNAQIIEHYISYMSGHSSKVHWKVRLWSLNKIKSYPCNRVLSLNSQRRHLSSLKNFFEYLIQSHEDGKRKFMLANPIKSKLHSIRVKDVDIEHTKLLNDSHWSRLEANDLNVKERLILNLLYYGGLRLAELTALDVGCLKSRTQTIDLVRKGGEFHRLKLVHFDHIYSLYLEYLSYYAIHEGPLFRNSKASRVSQRYMYQYIKRMLSGLDAKDNLSPHSFRKACATNLYKKTKDILYVRNYLNHKDAKVTQTYIEY